MIQLVKRVGKKEILIEYTENGDQWAELEPSFFLQKDGILVMVMRDQKNRYISLVAKSDDRGETWTKSMSTNMPDSSAK